MESLVNSFFVLFKNFIDFATLSIGILAIILSSFVVFFVLTIKRNEKKFIFCYLVTAVFLLLIQTGFLLVYLGGFALVIFNLSFAILPTISFLFVKKKTIVYENYKEIIDRAQDSIDKELDKESKEDNSFDLPKEKVLFNFEKFLDKTGVKKASKITTKSQDESNSNLDFSNVKRAIDKILLKDISDQERRQVLELEFAIFQREKGEDNLLVKEQVNEGLSSLLRLMAKYA